MMRKGAKTRYSVKLYYRGKLVDEKKDLTYSDVFNIYNYYNPFDSMGVDVFEDGERIPFGKAIGMFSDRSMPK